MRGNTRASIIRTLIMTKLEDIQTSIKEKVNQIIKGSVGAIMEALENIREKLD